MPCFFFISWPCHTHHALPYSNTVLPPSRSTEVPHPYFRVASEDEADGEGGRLGDDVLFLMTYRRADLVPNVYMEYFLRIMLILFMMDEFFL